MATLDWIIMIGFFLCLIGIVLWVVKHKKDDTSDYFLSGRSEIWMVVGQQIAHNKVFTMREFLLK
jgi:SSS family solute:Na+ symporter